MKTTKKNGNSDLKRASKTAKLITAYINENLSEDLHEKSVANIFRISISTLQHCCKEQHGISYRQFVESRRMLKARKMIEDERMLVKEAMAETGYKSRAAFAGAFKRVFGRTPSSFR